MKKVLILLIFTILLSFNTVSASQPIQDGLIKIELEKCDSRNLDYSDLRIDILLKTDDLRGNEIYIDYFNVDFDNPVMFELYKTNNPNYESYGFLDREGYMSYSAYVDPIIIGGRCQVNIDTYLEEHIDFIIIVHKGNGAVLLEEEYKIKDINNTDDHKFSRYFVYSREDNTLEIEQSRNWNPFVVVLFVFVVSVVLLIGFFIVTVKIQKKLVSSLLEEHEKRVYRDKFIGFNIISIIVAMIVLTSMYTGYYILVVFIFGIQGVGYYFIKKYKDKNFHPISNKRILIAQSIPLVVYALIVLSIYILSVFM